MDDSPQDVGAELARLRGRVTGVMGGIVTAVDGLLLGHDGAIGHDPHDLAALAAAAYGIGTQVGRVLNQGENQHIAIRGESGYYVVFAIDEGSLLGIVAEPVLNLAQLHIELRSGIDRFAEAARAARATRAAQADAADLTPWSP